jgi:cytochrome c oxidase subunit 2
VTFPILPPQASTTASRVDALCLSLIGICGAVLLGLLAVILFYIFKYRRGKVSSRSRFLGASTPYELTWTLIPMFLFMGMFAWGAVVYHDEQIPPRADIEVNVVGKQWMWKVQHPNGRREINELHVPVGQTVRVVLAAQDVIHSFYLPAFRIKQDVVPGRLTTEWFKATKTGVFHIFCAEYCGKDHSRMRGSVIVMNPADYAEWLRAGDTQPSLAQAGEQLFRSLGCSGCHMGSSVVRAPRLEGLFGRVTPLQDGRVVTADEGYIRDSIMLPGRDVAAGYEPVMPSYQGQITEDQVFELISYIKSFGAQKQEDMR